MNTSRRRAAAIAVLAASSLVLGTVTAVAAPGGNPNSSKKMRKAVSVEKIHRHLEAFQAVADEHGNRAAGTPGYEASAEYVEGVLEDAGYSTHRQYFPFLYFEQLAPEVLTENSPTQRDITNHVMSASPSTAEGGVTADLVAPAAVTGCTPEEWGGVEATDKVALISRGTCSFLQKSQAAAAAGVDAAIIYNNADGDLNGTLGNDPTGAIPTTGVTQADGEALAGEMAGGPVNVTLELLTTVEQRETFNVITETHHGSPDHTVMLGGHLDGVHDGAGINDNGSGTATLLTVATELAKVNKHRNRVRFAFWGAEESGLVGSTHYVNRLVADQPEKLDKIATYLNFDMIGSPNYIISTYDADESTYEAPVDIPPGSIETEDVFTDYFAKVGQDVVDYEFSGRSDYQAFINNGVAAGGLSSGSDGIKTAEQAALFGGTPGISYDPNYHSAQDDIDNVDLTALDIMSDAIAHATITLAKDASVLEPDGNDQRRRHVRTKVAPAPGTIAR